MMDHLGQGMGSEWEQERISEEKERRRQEEFLQTFGEPDHEPIEVRTSEAEKLYTNLLMVTDFEREFIENMLEFEPDEEAEMRIDELRRKRREMKELAQSPSPTKTIVI